MKKILTTILAVALVITMTAPSNVSAKNTTTKEENVYAVLNHDGSVDKIYVVSSFKEKNIIDYGDYTDIKNLTTTDKITYKEGKVTVTTSNGYLNYQGTLKSKELPWKTEIKYYLDKKVISAADIAGKSGKVEIHINIAPDKNVDPFFNENYTLSVSVSLDQRKCENIKAEGGVGANAGMYKQFTYTVLPQKSAQIVITTDATEFEMQAITLNAVRMSMDLQVDIGMLNDRFSQLSDAIKQLDEGAGEIADAFSEFNDGFLQYTQGLQAYGQGISQLVSGIDTINQSTYTLSNGLNEISKNSASLNYAMQAIQKATFDSVNAQLSQMQLPIPELTASNYSAILSQMPGMEQVKAELDNITALVNGFKQYTDGVDSVANGLTQINGGIYQLATSSKQLNEYTTTLYTSAVQLQQGADRLKQALVEYKKGINTLYKETSGMDDLISDELDDMISDMFGDATRIKSFVSDKNDNVESVQFVIKTKAIEYEKPDETVIEEPVVLTFWQKLLKLFGLYKE